MVDQKHNEMTLVLKILAAMIIISLVSLFISTEGAGNLAIACTASNPTAAGCTFNATINDTKTTLYSLTTSLNNVTSTPLVPVNTTGTFGIFGSIANIFIVIPNALAHVFGWIVVCNNGYTCNGYINGTSQGFLLNLFLLFFDVLGLVVVVVFFLVPTIIFAIGAGTGLGFIGSILGVVEIFTSGMVLVVGLYVIANRIWSGG